MRTSFISRTILTLGLVLALVPRLPAETKKFTHPTAVRSVALSPDSKLLATACQGEASIRIWDIAAGKEARTLSGAEGGTNFVAYSPDGKMLASGGRDGTVYLWDPLTAKEIGRLKGHEKEVTSAVFAPDSKTLASGGQDNTVRVWDVATLKELNQFKQANAVNCVAFSPDGKLLAVAGWFREVPIIDVVANKVARQCVGHQDSCVSVAFSPDGQLLASGSMEQAIRLWEVHSALEIRKIDDPRKQANSLAFSSDSRLLLACYEDRTVRLVDMALLWDPSREAEVDRNDEHQGPVFTAIFSADGKLIASGASDARAFVRDISGVYKALAQAGGEIQAKKLERYWAGLASRNPRQAHGAVWALAMAPKQSMAIFTERLTPIATLMDRQRVGQLITELNADAFPVREKATADLEKMGGLIDPILRKALMGVLPSLEVRRRIERILEKIKAEQGSGPSPDVLRAIRAVPVLERIGTPEARQLLEKFANGMPEAQLTQDAKLAVERINKRSNP